MRHKAAMILCLLLFIPLALQAKVTYQPSISISSGGTFTYKTSDILRSSYSVRADLDPLAIQFDNHCVSFPFSYTYVSRTPYFGGYCLNSHMDFGLGFAYRYDFNDLFSIKAILDVQLRYIHEVHGGIFAMGITAEPSIDVTDYISISVPLRAGFSKNEFNISPAIAINCMPLGGQR